ncbi:MAG: tetratricopeptide repeat protein [Planctomycetota bacterium]|nr:MAG: tetratricopeptide repeat protein [Planctomycetota bacterium]
MTETQVIAAPRTVESMDPAAFFAAPPQNPKDLVASRTSLMQDPHTADSFQSAVREARAGGNARVAAAGSWVTGEYRKALDFVDGDDELSMFIRGNSLFELQRYREAAEVLLGSLNAADTALSFAAYKAAIQGGELDKAEKALSKASLSEAETAFLQARLMEAQGQVEEAAAAYENLLQTHPDQVDARFRLAMLCDLYGDDQAALRHYETLLKYRPVPSAVLLNLGVLYEDQDRYEYYEKACGCYSAVLRRDPNNPKARLYFSDAHESLSMTIDEDRERKEDRLKEVLRTPITQFELSVRARNCLSHMEIRTLGDLVSHTEQELLEFKNFGETSLNEIKRLLDTLGLRLGMRREDGSFIMPDKFDANPRPSSSPLDWLGPLSKEQEQALEMPISALNLSVRCHRALVERLNLQKVGDILSYTEEDLLSQPNFGITSLKELNGKLTNYQLKLRSGRGDEYSGEG